MKCETNTCPDKVVIAVTPDPNYPVERYVCWECADFILNEFPVRWMTL